MKNNINKFNGNGYDNMEIAAKLLELTNHTDDDEIGAELERAIYDIILTAENKYNFDYWRVLLNILDELTTYD